MIRLGLKRLWVLVPAVLSLVGCAALQYQEIRVQEVRAMAEAAVAAYGAPPLPVQAQPLPPEYAAVYRNGTMVIASNTLTTWPDWLFWKVVAHEIAHHVLRHPWQHPAPQFEMDADTEAVKILQRFKGWSEARAFEAVYHHFCWLERVKAKLPRGHPPIQEKMADIKRRYPAHQNVRCPRA